MRKILREINFRSSIAKFDPLDLNLLAHLHLSEGCSPEVLTANVLADYLGRYNPVEKLPPRIATCLMPGILLHRQIDSFTDQHAVLERTRNLVSPERRRLAGIIVDIAFDYFLARHWAEFSSEERETTISRGYATMSMVATATGMNRETQSLIAKMRATNWLHSYSTLEGQALTFQRVSRRAPAVANLIGAEEEIVKNDPALDECFLAFYPDLMSNVVEWKKENL